MQVFRTLAGYSYGRADVVRRAMSKKKHDVMENEREVFINGLVSEDGTVLIDGAVRRGMASGGILHVTREETAVLIDSFEWEDGSKDIPRSGNSET